MIKSCLFILFLLPLTCFAQFVITGKVLSSTNKTPVANASVFLNNAVAGSKTDDKGAFTITNVRPGQYDLVVSSLGYETSHQNIMVNADVKLATIEISPKTMMLQEVKIRSNGNWKRDYEKFKRYFFGESAFADKCKILNKDLPDVLDLDYDSKTMMLTAKSNDFLEIENKALGYKIKYLLSDLERNARTGSFYYEGTAAFEELAGSESQIRRWKKNRLKAYEGSSMQFLRSVVTNTITDNGFKVLRLISKSDPGGISFGSQSFRTLVDLPLNTSDFVKPTDVEGEYALSFKDCLYVMYNKKRAHSGNTITKEWSSNAAWNDALITTLIFNEPYAFFDNNGIIINPLSISFDGNWGRRLMAELLPVDYVPGSSD
ncbi:carboxypeptidase-like regulatory domain-containing protein [Mucilaginibacter sp.]|uniref:carboxypeptidase-like regulatory domain-containing protein n=1 Tax=Mucilaginibacter sp. TaxID=1882438 RepID=UPI0026365596|nr:carboxypeptidase-like regulatory domain-containing protein [Mucilaginibacter sp.]MDB4922386.1 hypothetical protein [Mucilaginibacter sp.]